MLQVVNSVFEVQQTGMTADTKPNTVDTTRLFIETTKWEPLSINQYNYDDEPAFIGWSFSWRKLFSRLYAALAP